MYSSLIPLGVAAILFSSLFLGNWGWARIPELQPSFADLRLLTHTVDCIQDGTWSFNGPTCDPFGRSYNYPEFISRVFAFLDLGSSSTNQLGKSLGVIVVLSIVLPMFRQVLQSVSTLRVTVWGIAAVSPPVLLQLERANTDGFVLTAIGVAAAIYARSRTSSAVVAATTVGFKLFSFLTILSYVNKGPFKRSLTAFLVTGAAMLSISVNALPKLSKMQLVDDGYAFGFLSILKQYTPSLIGHNRYLLLVGTASFTLIPAVTLLRFIPNLVKRVSESVSEKEPGGVYFLLFGLTYVGTILAGSRYDYSLIFLLMTLTGIVLLPNVGVLGDVILGVGVVALWGAFWFDSNSVIGDMAAIAVCWMILAVLIRNRIDQLRVLLRARTG